MRIFLTALVAALLAGSAGATTSSGLHGRVMRGPTSPVCIAERPCNAPAKGLTLVFSRNGRAVGRTITSAEGFYRVALARGLYGVAAGTSAANHRLQPTRADVLAGQYRRLDFSIDTGIR
jgi:hypothetical protein